MTMADTIIGRKREIALLDAVCQSGRAELVAVYGRRRVGKTFLVKEYFHNHFDFYATGIFEGKRKDQLEAFAYMLQQKTKKPPQKLSSWMEAFMALRDYLEQLEQPRKVVFLDELPWFDQPAGQFLKAFEWFWNSWGSTHTPLKLIVCGSATTWMTDKFISAKGGLYNRTTQRIHLAPFNLAEAEALLRHNGLDWDRSLILEAYMTFGGVPLYLNMLQKDLSLAANVDRLFFETGAQLRSECDFLFRSLFKNSEYYMQIVDTIGRKNMGTCREEIVRKGKLQNNGALTKALRNLENCDFVRKYSAFGKKERDSLFQLTDLSILFHKRFVENYNGKDEHHWTNTLDSPARRAWTGIAFEQVCLLHLPQIKQALGISGVQTEVGSWRFAGDDYTPGTQIDMLIARRDRTINVCEMKYADTPYEITPKYKRELLERLATFRSVTKTRHALHLTLISPHGLRPNAQAATAHQVVTLDDLFQPTR